MTKKDSNINTISSLTALTQEFFTRLSFDHTPVKVSEVDDVFNIDVQIQPEISGILIGYHGETISSLQLILALLAHTRLGEWPHVVLNINDYRQRRQQNLTEMASAAATQATTTGQEVIMPPMESYDRRIIHLALSENPQVRSESVGEGKNRRLVIYPVSQEKLQVKEE